MPNKPRIGVALKPSAREASLGRVYDSHTVPRNIYQIMSRSLFAYSERSRLAEGGTVRRRLREINSIARMVRRGWLDLRSENSIVAAKYRSVTRDQVLLCRYTVPYIRGRRMYTNSDIHSCGEENARTSVSGGFTAVVVRALGRRYSSTETSERGGGTAKGDCCGRGTRLFLR
jgi:hypothetical protein